MPNRPIPVSQANAMIKTYNTYMQTLGVDMKKQTHCVGFKLTELMAWLNKMTEIADEIRVCMGDYPDGNPEAGRTTVILWPYKDGQPARTTDKSLATEPGTGIGGDDGGDPGDGGDDGDDCDNGNGDPGDDGDPADPFNEGQLYP